MRSHVAHGEAEKRPSGAHPAAIMALAKPMAMVLIFSGHSGDCQTGIQRREMKITEPFFGV